MDPVPIPPDQRRLMTEYNLYFLKPILGITPDRWDPWFDKAFGFVVRAENEPKARQIAAYNCGDEGEDAWVNPKLSSCEILTADGEPGMIIQDFHSA